jgi:hypothetical protein
MDAHREAGMTDTGVVDPIRIPPWVRPRLERAWATTPLLARVFIGLAVVDILSRWFGVLQPRVDFGLIPAGPYAFFIPHDLWILLPTILLIRRPDATQATPLIVAGAIVGAVAMLLGRPFLSLAVGGQDISLFEWVGAIQAAVVASSFLLLARGLRRLNPRTPAAATAGLSNIVLGMSLLGTGIGLATSLIHMSDDAIGAMGTGVEAGSILASTASGVCWAYLLWIVVRGLGDSRRPGVALATAAVGAALSGILTGMVTVIDQVLIAAQSNIDFSTLQSFQDPLNALGFMATGVGGALVLVAFALGLAEPPVPYIAPGAVEPRSPGEALPRGRRDPRYCGR